MILAAIPAGTELVVVMPVYNEAKTILRVLQEWVDTLGERDISFSLLALNDGSTDETAALLREASARLGSIIVIENSNSGHGRTCRAGYEMAVASSASWVLQTDSDGQCDPAYFAEFWDAKGEVDCVFGVRTWRGDGLVRHMISWFCTAAVVLLTGEKLRDANVPYRLIRREVLADALWCIPREFELHNIALSVALQQRRGLRWKWIPMRFLPRPHGTKKLTLRKIARLGFGMLAELRTIQPAVRRP